jgi:hypothetical protein
VTKEQFSEKLEAGLFKKYRLNNGGVVEDNNNDNNGDSYGNYRKTKESSFLPAFFFLLIQFLYAPLGSEILSSVPLLNIGI